VQNDHLTTEELAAYVDGVMGAEERRYLEAHLIDCRQCLDDVVALLMVLKPGNQHGERR
jgi:anti-sigma factor RsiW